MATLNQRILTYLEEHGESPLPEIKEDMVNKYMSTNEAVSKAVYDLLNNRKSVAKRVQIEDGKPVVMYRLVNPKLKPKATDIVDEIDDLSETVQTGVQVVEDAQIAEAASLEDTQIAESQESFQVDTESQSEQIEVTPDFAFTKGVELITQAFNALQERRQVENLDVKLKVLEHFKVFIKVVNEDFYKVLCDIQDDLRA